jgi:hypothetical protein
MSELPKPPPASTLTRAFFTLSRLCITAWFGVSLFFVSIVIGLRGSPLFSDETKLRHPKVLFPLFYSFEFWLLGMAFVAGLMAYLRTASKLNAERVYLGLIGLALLVAAGDFFSVYVPLKAMLDMSTLPPEFTTYHVLSRWVNTLGVLLCGAASILGLWPARSDKSGC